MGDAYEYPEIRMARFQYAMRWLPPNVRADYPSSSRPAERRTGLTTIPRYHDGLIALGRVGQHVINVHQR
eukprot:scaffold9591_cov98-Isochrysis_galbana.AAC.3